MTTEPINTNTGRRDDGVLVIAGYHFVVAAFFLLGAVVLAFPTVLLGILGIVEDPGALIGMVVLGAVAVVTLLTSILFLVVGYGLWTFRQWGRTAAIVLGVLSLFFVPIGTIAGGLTLWHLLKPEVAEQFQ
jgi:hypothetical protein